MRAEECSAAGAREAMRLRGVSAWGRLESGARLPGSKEQEPAVFEALTRTPRGRQQPRHGDARRPLDIVVEAELRPPVRLEHLEGGCVAEVLELHNRPGENLFHCGAEFLDEREVSGPAEAAAAEALVPRVVEERLGVCTHVEAHWEAFGGRNPA